MDDNSEAEAALNVINSLAYSSDTPSAAGASTVATVDTVDTVADTPTQTTSQGNLIVPYDPENPTKRLGRPRKNLPPSEPPIDSSKNENEAILSKFRLNDQPVEGPGSRGGKHKLKSRGRIDNGRQRKQQKQMTLNLSGGNVALKDTSPKKPKLVLKISKKKPTTTKSNCSRTTVKNSRNKLTRQLPGPLVGLYYDLYDENLQDEYGQSEQLALGYPVTASVYGGDITFLIAYLLKFGDVLNWEKNIGPGDIEKGLGLIEGGEVSGDMTSLFGKLLTVILNRKKEITAIPKAIADLKPMTNSLGLPYEWTTITKHIKSESNPANPEDIVDPTHPDILIPTNEPTTISTTITYNPFYDSPEIESQGLSALHPHDRLILLRTLAQWSLTSSDLIKQAISQSIQTQDIPGDRETQYAARSIIYGTKNCLDTKRDSEIKLAKRKQEDEVKYIDPTSNPLVHSLNLRINQLVIGDLGFNIGRFYLSRMSQDYNGGLASIKRMERVRNGTPMSPLPSEFKLYVEDTYSMLVNALSQDGVEFKNGDEVKSTTTIDKPIWYEVASNTEQLESFVQHLHSKIQDIPAVSVVYKPVVQLHEYLNSLLPLLKKQEDITKETVDVRSTRKIIDYSATHHAYEEEEEEEEEEIQVYEDVDDDDNYEDITEDEDEYME